MSRTVDTTVPLNGAGPMAPGHLAGDPQVLRLIAHYLEILEDTSAPGTPELQDLAAVHVRDLLSLALRPACEAAGIAPGNCRRAVRLQAILAEIAAGFADPEFSLVDVARKLAISPRYLQHVLQDTGRSFTARITELRLNKARALLARESRRKIVDIAYDCGFGDVSHFNRRFRRRFGAAPSKFRNAHTMAAG
ncbi:MAG TPA: helix-turn-helix transcriptional regulator [Xanthobacteraceae bacterium]|nr:helix-turn-helix transcriptional regulator [Xanthobacteraceae bacterium]